MKSSQEFARTNKHIAYAVAAALVALFVGYYLGGIVQQAKYQAFLESFKTIRENSDKYKFINPLIGGVSNSATEVGIFKDIQGDITSYLQKQKLQGNLYDYSLYFRDLNTGLWFGDHESASFFPASLFKLPISIAAYRQGEDDPAFLEQKVIYTKELDDLNRSAQLNAQSSLVVGQAYDVHELVESMLILSDNGAKDALLSILDKNYLNQLFNIVSLIEPTTTQTYEVSSRKYAYFLRILYGSSYLNEEHSELILGLLTKSTFKDGLIAGIPGHVLVAHKFGVYEVPEVVNGKEHQSLQLHDCGVVYHATKPYLLCFMTKGKDADALFKIISHVSKMVYEKQEENE